MRKSRIIILALFVLALLLGGIAGYGFIMLRDVQEPLLAFLKSHIHGDLKIGSAKVMFVPTGIDLEEVTLYAPGETEPSASIERAKLRFKLLPLIQKKIETTVIVLAPEIHLHQDRDGTSNMKEIFSPLISGQAKSPTSPIDELWWKRIAVNKLVIKEAHFKATQAGSDEVTELENISIEAKQIRFESGETPADIKIQFALPQVSRVPMELATQLLFDEKSQTLQLQNGSFRWGAVVVQLGGRALFPTSKRKEVELDLTFQAQDLSLKSLAKVLTNPLPLSGDVSLTGTITGTPFRPNLSLTLDSGSLYIKGKSLANLHAELAKHEKPIEIKNTSFGIYGGTATVSGKAIRQERISADLNVILSSLSLASIAGKPGNPARLSGHLKLKSNNIENLNSFSGGGSVTIGPIVLPDVNLGNKVRVAEILAAVTGLDEMVNVGMLATSSNVIGTRIEEVKAKVMLANGNITVKPFSMANGHFDAQGTASVIGQEKLEGGTGTFTLNRRVTRELITDRSLRQTLTKGSDQLSIPFSISGPVSDPQVSIDRTYLKEQLGQAMVVVLQRQALRAIQPQKIIDQALQGGPPGDPANPLEQIFKAPPKPAPDKKSPPPETKKPAGFPPLDEIIFGR